MVRLEKFADRRPAQLSGGQQQRVALARALVFEPSLVLMDEPLGALDKKLREQLQIEIKLLHERLGLTVVYVTHDQSEALTMSDRIAIFHDGELVQQGTPDVAVQSAARCVCRGIHRREQHPIRPRGRNRQWPCSCHGYRRAGHHGDRGWASGSRRRCPCCCAAGGSAEFRRTCLSGTTRAAPW